MININIAEINEKIVGCLNFSGGPRQRIAHVGEFAVSVLKEYWGNGIGKELIKYLISMFLAFATCCESFFDS